MPWGELHKSDYDGPSSDLNSFEQWMEKICKETNHPLKKIGYYPGSLGNYAGHEHNIFTLTLELPSSDPGKGVSISNSVLLINQNRSLCYMLPGSLFTREGTNCHNSIFGSYMTIDYIDLIIVADLTFQETIFIGLIQTLVVIGNYGNEFFRGSRRFD
jgi:hypothetical protein